MNKSPPFQEGEKIISATVYNLHRLSLLLFIQFTTTGIAGSLTLAKKVYQELQVCVYKKFDKSFSLIFFSFRYCFSSEGYWSRGLIKLVSNGFWILWTQYRVWFVLNLIKSVEILSWLCSKCLCFAQQIVLTKIKENGKIS